MDDKPWSTKWQDYYAILGISNPKADAKWIKEAYIYKQEVLHPDRVRDKAQYIRDKALEEIKEVNNAYRVLRDPKKRAEYDADWLMNHQAGNTDASWSQNANPGRSKTHSAPRPKPEAKPANIRFINVAPGELRTTTFEIRNTGGPISSNVRVIDPKTWIKIVGCFAASASDTFPLTIEIEATGMERGKTYRESIVIDLGGEETRVNVEMVMKPEQRLRELPFLGIAGLTAVLFGILAPELVGPSSLVVYFPFMVIIGIWVFILLEGTNRSALNYPSKPVPNRSNLLSVALLECTLAFSVFYLYQVFGISGAISVFLFAPLAIGMILHNVKTSGYCILLPLAFIGGVSIEANVYSIVLPNGQLLALLCVFVTILVGYILYRSKERTVPAYVLSFLLLGLTSLGIYAQVSSFGVWPFLFLFESIVVISLLIAHPNLVGKFNLAAPYRSIKRGRALFVTSILFFIFGVYRALSLPSITGLFGSPPWSLPLFATFLQSFELLLLALVLFSLLALIRSKYTFTIAFALLVSFSGYGIFSLVQTNLVGIWNPPIGVAFVIWMIISVLFYYEPAFKFMKYFTPLPDSFSLERFIQKL